MATNPTTPAPNTSLHRTPAAAPPSPVSSKPLGVGRCLVAFCVVSVTLLWVAQEAWAQSKKAALESSGIEPALKVAIAERQRANLKGDTQQIEALMAAEYVQTDVGGRVQTKSEWLTSYFKPLADMIKRREFRWTAWEESDVQTRTFGDTVVVVGKLKLEGEGATFVPGRDWVKSAGGKLGPTTMAFTRVWIKRDGKWLLAAIHNALPPPAK